jgi:hypothetical protein
MKTTANKNTVKQALENVNQAQGYELEFNRFDRTGKYVNFTLKTASKIPGARVSWSGRNLAKASWHAHGYLFDEIFKIEPEAVIISLGKKITINDGNWEDMQIGSLASPCYMSQTSIL